jgi:hypothetical protein
MLLKPQNPQGFWLYEIFLVCGWHICWFTLPAELYPPRLLLFYHKFLIKSIAKIKKV